MNLVAILILGSISLLPPGDTDCSRTQQRSSWPKVLQSASHTASPSALMPAHASSPVESGLADRNAVQGDDDDNFDDDAYNVDPLHLRVASTSDGLSRRPQPSRCHAHTVGRTLPIRC
jgi:hypothetical protein